MFQLKTNQQNQTEHQNQQQNRPLWTVFTLDGVLLARTCKIDVWLLWSMHVTSNCYWPAEENTALEILC